MYRALALIALMGLPLLAGGTRPTVVPFESFQHAYQYGPFLISAQPDLDLLKAAKADGVSTVINLREDKEIREFEATHFKEEPAVRNLGMAYVRLPLGTKDSYRPEAVEALAKAVAGAKGRVLIHCHSGARATLLLMAYLVRDKGMDLNSAIDLGRSMAFHFPLEGLLGAPVTFSLQPSK